MSLLCVNINALGGKRTENGRCGCHPPEWITPFNLSDLQCLHVGWCEVKLGRPLDFFYTGLPDHRRNSYLSLELIMPSLPPPTHLDVKKSAFLISLDAVRKITTSQACVSACVLEQVTSGTVKDGEKEHEIG